MATIKFNSGIMKKVLFILTFFVCGAVSAQQYFFNGTVYVPKTTTEINAISSPQEGRQEYNSTTGTMWVYDGSDWVDTGEGIGVGVIPVTQAEYDLLSPTEIAENDYAIVDESMSSGVGDMLKSIYDTNNNGSVDTVDDGSVSAVKLSSSFYDTGVFTPTLIDAGGGATYSLSIEIGKYTRIGNIVYVWAYVSITGTTGTPTGYLRLGNLPISAPSNTHAISVGRFQGSDVSFYSIYGYVWNDYIEFSIQTSLDGSVNEPLDDVTFSSGAIVVSGTYTID